MANTDKDAQMSSDQKFFVDLLQRGWVNEPAVKRRVLEIKERTKSLVGENRKAWLLKAIGFIDLTTLAGDDTSTNVDVLCQKAANPLKLPEAYQWDVPLHTAAVCVYPSRVGDASSALDKYGKATRVAVAVVAAGFPSGQCLAKVRKHEVKSVTELEVEEVDIVIDRALALSHNWNALLAELRDLHNNSEAHVCMKTILSTGELFSLKDVYIASMIAIRAGTDFIKTSTGKETVNATLPVGIVMCRAIKDHYMRTKERIGFKPAGGIKTAQEALEWMVLVKTELGDKWLTPRLFRIGASSLLDNITAEILKN